MHTPTKVFILSSIGAAAIALWSFLPAQSTTAKYSPRPAGVQEEYAGMEEYLNMLRANGVTGEIDPAIVAQEWQDLSSMPSAKTTSLMWDNKGPDNFGGRTRALLVDKNNSAVVFAGSVGGGLFKSTNGGATWNVISDPGANQSVASITQASNGDIYYGTGEIFLGYGGTGQNTTPNFAGGGIYKSTDGGMTFTHLSSTTPSSVSGSGEWSAVADLAAHPTVANTLYAATNTGFKKSTDGGATWATVLSGGITDFAISTSGKIFLNRSGQTMYSADGNTFNEISSPVVTATSLPRRTGSRMRYAISPQDENYVYVVQTNGSKLAAVYRSTDGGTNWTKIGQRGNNFDPLCNGSGTGQYCQGIYDLLFAVSSSNKDHIWLGGITVWQWDLNQGWGQVSTLNNFGGGNPYYLHADSHEMVFDPNNSNIVYASNDGGVFKSTDHGQTWTERNLGYTTFQYFGFGVGKDRKLIGGCQDNGTSYFDQTLLSPNSAKDVLGGDGGHSDISWLRPKVMFAETQSGNFYRSDNEGQSWSSFASPLMNLASQRGFPLSNWMMPFELWETSNDVNSEDSVNFELLPAIRSMGYGDGIKKVFKGKMRHSQDAAIYMVGTFNVDAGPVTLTADAQGNINSADGSGIFVADSGYFEITFTSAPLSEVIMSCDVYLPTGSDLTLPSAIGGLPIEVTTGTLMNVGDSYKTQDPVQAMFFAGLSSWSDAAFPKIGGIWMTREVHSFGSTEWWQIAHLGAGTTPQYMKASNDGDHLFVGTTNGRVYRISNLQAARSKSEASIDSVNDYVLTVTQIGTFPNRVITGIDVDPNDANRVAVSLGNYGNTNFVYVSTNALAGAPTFSPKQGNLPNVPAYSVSFDKGNANRLVVGTEWGIFMTDNVSSGAPTYAEENDGMARIPVFEIEQYRTNENFDPMAAGSSETEGDFFIATHGRGLFHTASTSTSRPVSLNERPNATKGLALGVYPNPAVDRIQVPVEAQGEVHVSVRTLEGRIVRRLDLKRIPLGLEHVAIDLTGLSKGSYVVTRTQNGDAKSEIMVVR
jgi:photosystem II stability/assembly factor-like uncharacterized protein